MPTYLYCVLPIAAEAPTPMPIGVGGTLARVLRADPIAAWVETVGERSLVPTVERVKAHDVVTETALITGFTPLPARFGQTFETDDACIAALRAQEARLLADLDAVRDLVEMRVVIALAADRPADPVAQGSGSPGRAYMQRLMGMRGEERVARSAASSLRNELRRVVGPFVRREACAVRASPTIVTLSHLVSRADAARYKAAMRDARFTTPVEQFVVQGPGAPYEFVSPPA